MSRRRGLGQLEETLLVALRPLAELGDWRGVETYATKVLLKRKGAGKLHLDIQWNETNLEVLYRELFWIVHFLMIMSIVLGFMLNLLRVRQYWLFSSLWLPYLIRVNFENAFQDYLWILWTIKKPRWEKLLKPAADIAVRHIDLIFLVANRFQVIQCEPFDPPVGGHPTFKQIT